MSTYVGISKTIEPEDSNNYFQAVIGEAILLAASSPLTIWWSAMQFVRNEKTSTYMLFFMHSTYFLSMSKQQCENKKERWNAGI